MTTKYFAVLTNQGAALLANAAALGTKVNITSMAVGDGGGTLPTPDPAQTKLVGEKRRAQLNALTIDTANSSQIIAEQIIPEGDGGFWIREIGLFDDAGVMIAVANCAETYKPQLVEGSGRTQTVRMILIVNSTTAVTLKVDPAVVLATRQYVDNAVIEVKAYADTLMKNHTDASNPHSQYLQTAEALSELKEAGLVAETLENLGLMSAAQRAVGVGSKQVPDMSFFGMLAASPGYQILPGGIVFQWGIAAVPVAGSVNIKYPITIDVGLSQFATPVDVSSTNNYRVGVANSDKTSVTLTSTNTASVTGVMWLSIGKMNQ
ncbi:phage tail protein [Pantoea rwandensis]|uniref:phage tail protein n=1 Tax=Pantoea rwandensis TaxID=1076550 RepID=UPI0009E023B6|nr:phage tail protein [Pantoea rwandensis]